MEVLNSNLRKKWKCPPNLNLTQSKLVSLLSLRMLTKKNGVYSLPKSQCETLTKKTRKNWSELSQRPTMSESSCVSSLKRSKYYLSENSKTRLKVTLLIGVIKSSPTSTTTSNVSFFRSKDSVSTAAVTQYLWRISPTPVLTLATLFFVVKARGLGIFQEYEPDSSVFSTPSLKRLLPVLLFSSLPPNNRWSTPYAAKGFPTWSTVRQPWQSSADTWLPLPWQLRKNFKRNSESANPKERSLSCWLLSLWRILFDISGFFYQLNTPTQASMLTIMVFSEPNLPADHHGQTLKLVMIYSASLSCA